MNSFGIRFSLRSLLRVIALVAMALGVVHSNAEWIASLCVSVLLFVHCIAIVGAICQTGGQRVFWLAFFVFGYGYGLSAFHNERVQSYWSLSILRFNLNAPEYSPTGPAFLADSVFELMEARPKPGDEVSAIWQNSIFYSATVREISADGQLLVAWTDGSPPTWVAPHKVSVQRIQGRIAGQSLTAILVGLLGAFLCQAVFRNGDKV